MFEVIIGRLASNWNNYSCLNTLSKLEIPAFTKLSNKAIMLQAGHHQKKLLLTNLNSREEAMAPWQLVTAEFYKFRPTFSEVVSDLGSLFSFFAKLLGF